MKHHHSNSFTRHLILCAAGAALAAASPASAQITPASLPGSTQTDGWTGLTAANNPGYPGFPGSSPWPSPIGSNTSGSGDAGFDKLSGNGYPGSASIYAPFVISTFAVSDGTPVPDLETVVFQIDIGTGAGSDFASGGAPVLSFNGGAQQLSATFSQLVSSTPGGDIGFGPITRNIRAFQWDLTAISGAITSISVAWSTAPHAQIYALQLDQGDVMLQVVPEPGTAAIGILLLAGAAHGIRRCRRRAAKAPCNLR